MVFREQLDFIGVDIRRLCFSWVSAAEGAMWAHVVNDFTKEINELGPFGDYRKLTQMEVVDADVKIDKIASELI